MRKATGKTLNSYKSHIFKMDCKQQKIWKELPTIKLRLFTCSLTTWSHRHAKDLILFKKLPGSKCHSMFSIANGFQYIGLVEPSKSIKNLNLYNKCHVKMFKSFWISMVMAKGALPAAWIQNIILCDRECIL